MDSALRDAVLAEYAKRKGLSALHAGDVAALVGRILADCSPVQRGYIRSKAKRKVNDTGRRGGKSGGVARDYVITSLEKPRSFNPFIAVTRDHAKNILWDTLKEINTRYDVGARPNETDLTMRFRNGSVIKLAGADKPKEIEKFRGMPMGIGGTDESGSFGAYLGELIEQVLEPATMDLDGVIFMAGTPANHCMGMFFEAATGRLPGWEHFHWTWRENPFLPNAEAWVQDLLQRKGWSWDHPVFRREYLGEWVRSNESSVYFHDDALNAYDELPAGLKFSHILGIDLGASDDDPKTAFAVRAFSEDHPISYTKQAYKSTKMTPTEIADEIGILRTKHGQFRRIVMDTGALGKAIAREITKRHGIPIVPAEKTEKYDYIELLNDDSRRGLSKIHRKDAEQLRDERSRLQWDEDRRKEDKRFPNHVCDADLYAWRECRQWMHAAETPKPRKGSSEYLQKQADEMEQRALDKVDGEKGRNWWEPK